MDASAWSRLFAVGSPLSADLRSWARVAESSSMDSGRVRMGAWAPAFSRTVSMTFVAGEAGLADGFARAAGSGGACVVPIRFTVAMLSMSAAGPILSKHIFIIS
jgi:hypothetical protein